MKCPHCGGPIEAVSSQVAWQQRQLAKGCCPRCGKEKTGADAMYRECVTCRKKTAARSQARYRRRRYAHTDPERVAARG